MNKEYVYVLDFGDRIKIGLTNNPERRFSEIEKASGCIIKQKYYREVFDMKIIESKMHLYYRKFRSIGEYFKGIEFKNVCKRLNMLKDIPKKIKKVQYIKKEETLTMDNPYKNFVYTIKGIEQYKMTIAKGVGKYGAFLLPLIDAVNEDNSIDMNLFQERNKISDGQINRLIKSFKDNNVLIKKGFIFYLNPLIAFNGKDIRLDLGILFKDELKKVGITIK